MNSLNSILLEGNLTRDPETKQTPKGTAICTFSVATNRYFRMGESLQNEVSFFDVDVWGGLADKCAEDLSKGRGVRVVGRLKQDRWIDADGKNHSKVKIVAEHVEFKPQFSKEAEDEEATVPSAAVDEESVLTAGSPV